jgi:hypothetical protein
VVLSLVSPSGGSHVEVAWVNGLDSFSGDVVTEEVAKRWMDKGGDMGSLFFVL